MIEEQLESIWKQYHFTRDEIAKEKLINYYMKIVRIIVNKLGIYQYQYLEVSDLISYGVIGLIDAIERFDPEKNVKFESYASLRIRGHIIDSIRKVDWIPRTARQKQSQIKNAESNLQQKYHRIPTDQEMMECLNMSSKQYYKTVNELAATDIVQLDTVFYEVEKKNEMISVETKIERQESLEELADAISQLNEREQKIIALYYYEELTFKEIGSILEISESRISQIHHRILTKLRKYLKDKEMFIVI